MQVNHTLTSVNLFSNDIGEDVAAVIGEALKVECVASVKTFIRLSA